MRPINSSVESNIENLESRYFMSAATIIGTNGADTIQAFYNSNTNGVTMVVNGVQTAVPAKSNIYIYAGSGGDTITIGTAIPASQAGFYIFGEAGNDSITGGAGNDQILGGTGNDTIHGGDGNDLILGEDGDDSLFADTGGGVLSGEAGNDYLQGSPGGDVLLGGTGADSIFGQPGSDFECADGTSYDSNGGALGQILGKWDQYIQISSGGSYLQDYKIRVDSLRTGFTGTDGAFYQMNASTVSNDGATDHLQGGDDREYFIFSGSDIVSDRQTTGTAVEYIDNW